MTRLFDVILSVVGIILISPLFLAVSLWVVIDAGFPVFFKQTRVGKDSKKFKLFKFRTMRLNAESSGQLTIGNNDSRITRSGAMLRKFKLDELPQLFNVLIGDMSFVGPRPEVEKYVMLYNEEQRKILTVRPGITDLASIEYIRENEILGKSTDPEATYISEIMPHKIQINLSYLKTRTLMTDLAVIIKTIGRMVR